MDRSNVIAFSRLQTIYIRFHVMVAIFTGVIESDMKILFTKWKTNVNVLLMRVHGFFRFNMLRNYDITIA